MRWTFAPLTLVTGAIVAGLAGAQTFESLPECGQACVNSVIASGLGCDSGDNECLCASNDFGFGLRDCAQEACEQAVIDQLAAYSDALCATPAAESPEQPPPEASATAPTSTASNAGQTSEPQSPSTPQPSPTSANEGPTPPQETETQAETTTDSAGNNDPSGQTSPSTSATSSATPVNKSTSADTDDEDNQQEVGLSTNAKIGIGVGAGAGILVFALLVTFLLKRRSVAKKRSRSRTIQISDPMPGSGRDYSGGVGNLSEKNASDLEVKSKRYEDMVPRQTPRHMI